MLGHAKLASTMLAPRAADPLEDAGGAWLLVLPVVDYEPLTTEFTLLVDVPRWATTPLFDGPLRLALTGLYSVAGH